MHWVSGLVYTSPVVKDSENKEMLLLKKPIDEFSTVPGMAGTQK